MFPPLLFSSPTTLTPFLNPFSNLTSLKPFSNSTPPPPTLPPPYHHHHHYHKHLQPRLSETTLPIPSHSQPHPLNLPKPTSSKPTTQTITTLLQTLQTSIRAHNPSKILKTFLNLQSYAGPSPPYRPLPSILSTLWHKSLSFLFRRGHVNIGLRVLNLGEDLLPIREIGRKSYVECLKVLVKNGRWKILQEVIGRMWEIGRRGEWGVNVKPDERLIAMVGNGCVEAGRLDLAVRFVKNMESFGVGCNCYCYSVLLKGFGRRGMVGKVEKVLEGIEKRELEWDVVLLNAVVDAYVRCGELEKAENFVGDGLEGVGSLANVRTFNTLVKGFAERKMIIKAFAVADVMKGLGIMPDSVTINSLILACVRAGKYEQAWQLIDSQWDILGKLKGRPGYDPALKSSLMLDRQMVIALTTIVSGVAQEGGIDEALGMLDEMEKKGVRPNRVTYTALMSACLQHKKVEQALDIFNDLRGAKDVKRLPGLPTYNALLVGLAQTESEKNIHVAEQLLHQMTVEDGVQPNEMSFNAVMDGWVRTGFVGRAERVMNKINKARVRLTSVPFTTLIKGYSQKGNFGKAKFWFQAANQAGANIDRICLNSFVAASCRAKEFALAERTLAFMETTGGDYRPNQYSYSPLIAARCRAWDLEGACATYKRMRKSGTRANAYIVEMLMTCITTVGPSHIANGQREVKEQFLTQQAITLFRDAFRAGIHGSRIMEWRKILTNMIRNGKCLAELSSYKDPIARAHGRASEQIFQRHNWNPIDSGFRAL